MRMQNVRMKVSTTVQRVPREVGEKFELDAPTAAKLVERGIVELVPDTETATAEPAGENTADTPAAAPRRRRRAAADD